LYINYDIALETSQAGLNFKANIFITHDP